MESAQHNRIVNFIWNIANDVLVHAFEKGEYKNVVLPFTVLRRIDILLEETKKAVLEKQAFCEEHKIKDSGPLLQAVTGFPFYNTSRFTMKTLKNNINAQKLEADTYEYLNGFSPDVQDIIAKFDLRHTVSKLSEVKRLGAILDKFTDTSINLSSKPVLDADGKELLPALDNHSMGTIFEELLRRFNEEHNVTEAGEHFTPRDYVKLLARLAVEPVKDRMKTNHTYTIYDGACGTGGILTVTQEEMKRIAAQDGKQVKLMIFGQELNGNTYATCKADLMIAGDIKDFRYKTKDGEFQYIAFGSTISEDGHKGEKFDFCVSNPPFGTPWKKDLENWGLGEKEKGSIADWRFYDGETSFVPGIGDCQMLFLANNLSRMRDTEMGTRIVEVHNGSSLFTGDAGGGESNLRRYIIENDMLEAIVAMPEKDFYNTGIGTYIWVVTNRKEERRKGKVQLIDATNIFTPLKKNLGEKNCETSETDADKIMKLLMDFKETPESKIFDNEEFGYWEVPVLRPKRDQVGNIVRKKGKVVMAQVKRETEQIPLKYPGGIEGFYEKEVKPYDSEVELGEPTIGYELSFTKYFYKPVELRGVKEIMAELSKVEDKASRVLKEIMG
jgi:type I restriction enzyme M protein